MDPAPPRRTPRGVGGLTGLRPLPPTPEKYVGLRSPPSCPRFFDLGLHLSASSPRVSTRRVIQNAKSSLLPSPTATVVATCFDVTSDMNSEVSFLRRKVHRRSLSGTEKTSKGTLRDTFWGQKLVEITVRAPRGSFGSPGGEIVDSSRELLEKNKPN